MTTEPKPRSPLARRLLLAGALAGSFVVGGLVFSGAAGAAETMVAAHCGMMGHGPMGHGGDMHAMMAAHIDKMLTAVDATPDQRARFNAILGDAMRQMGPLHAGFGQTHAELHRLLLAPTIDRGALEQLRAAKIAELDQASRAMVKAFADAAEVLTPEQRAKVGRLMAEHHPS